MIPKKILLEIKKSLPKTLECKICGKEFDSKELDDKRLEYQLAWCNDCYNKIREVMSGESGKIIVGQIYYSLKKLSNQLGIDEDDDKDDDEE